MISLDAISCCVNIHQVMSEYDDKESSLFIQPVISTFLKPALHSSFQPFNEYFKFCLCHSEREIYTTFTFPSHFTFNESIVGK